jgi:hypothetical protein
MQGNMGNRKWMRTRSGVHEGFNGRLRIRNAVLWDTSPAQTRVEKGGVAHRGEAAYTRGSTAAGCRRGADGGVKMSWVVLVAAGDVGRRGDRWVVAVEDEESRQASGG